MSLKVDIRTRVGSFALEAALTAHSGEVLAVLGPNGSGKSTLLGTIAGLFPAHEGHIKLTGRVLEGPGAGGNRRVWLPPERRRVALLGQRAMLLPHLSARENVAFGPRAQGVPRTLARERAMSWLDEVGMGEYAQRRPAQLSGGQQQRVALARALAAEPDALLLDEPFTSLDTQTAAQARRLIAEQRDRAGVPMILVTHDPMDAVVLAARTLVLREGHVEQQGTTAEVLGHPRSQFVAAMAGVNLVAGVAEADGTLRCADGLRWVGRGEHVPTGEAATCVFAPGSVRIHPAAGPSEASAANSWSGVVAVMDPVPGGIRLFTAEYPRLAIECPSTTALALGIRPGVELAFSIDVDDISVRCSR